MVYLTVKTIGPCDVVVMSLLRHVNVTGNNIMGPNVTYESVGDFSSDVDLEDFRNKISWFSVPCKVIVIV